MMKTPPRCTIVLLLLFAAAACFAEESAPPRATDDRLTFELFAESPMIVTPTGIAVDREGRVFVAESHTHMPPDDYEGPETDRIRVFEDTDGDGKADRASTFYDGLVHTMDLAFHPDGSLYVSTRDRIIRLRDTDGDLKADEAEPIVRLQTSEDYPHNGLSSMEFGFGGDLYFGLGTNSGQSYALIGSDGTKIVGGGGAGRIVRCNADGSDVRSIARGLWNPFGLCRDAYGRMFLTDNDPHDRPPCRLIHVVPGGDYGYERRYGSGLHPLNAWNGELPGTLPMVSGTAEAPGGLIAYGSDGLPAEYRGRLMTPAWSDHRIEVFPLQRLGASFTAQRQTLVQGGDSFRPVDLAVAPDGSIYVSDWGSSSYQVNGKGRIWRLAMEGR